MTGRERMNALLHQQSVDRLPWTTLVDGNTLNLLPEELRGNGGIDFYKYLGCDILLLDGWGTPHAFRGPERRWAEGVAEEWKSEGEVATRELRTPAGTLTSVFRRGHPVKYPVDSLEALHLYRELWEGTRFINYDDYPTLAAIDGLIGDAGIVTRFWGPSTIPLLLENEMGAEQFYYFLEDFPEEMEALINLMHDRELEAFHILADGPVDVVTLCENTSTYYIGPGIYRLYNMPHVRDFVEIAHAAGKTALIHMCGHVHDILSDFKETGADGIHALTPPPVGNTEWEHALDVLGDDHIIIGILDPSTFCMSPIEEIGPTLDRIYTDRLRRANFCLWLGADGLAIPLERFEAVRRWMNRSADL